MRFVNALYNVGLFRFGFWVMTVVRMCTVLDNQVYVINVVDALAVTLWTLHFFLLDGVHISPTDPWYSTLSDNTTPISSVLFPKVALSGELR